MKQIVNEYGAINYYATEDGHIYSKKTNKVLSERKTYRGYLVVNLSINGYCRTYPVHRLIAIAFIPNPNKLPAVNHKNGIKSDNRVENLEWVSFSENSRHALDNNLAHPARGKNTKHGRFEENDILHIRNLYKNGKTQLEIAKMYNVTKGTIQQIVRGSTYSYIK